MQFALCESSIILFRATSLRKTSRLGAQQSSVQGGVLASERRASLRDAARLLPVGAGSQALVVFFTNLLDCYLPRVYVLQMVLNLNRAELKLNNCSEPAFAR